MTAPKAVLALLLLLSGCAAESTAPPVSTGRSSASQAQSPNSLPRGSAVNAPLLGTTGTVTTRVGP